VPSGLRGASLNSSEKKIYDLLTVDNPSSIDDIVEGFALDSSPVLAARFDLERKGGTRQLPGKPILQDFALPLQGTENKHVVRKQVATLKRK
jgi:hypothetical protein